MKKIIFMVLAFVLAACGGGVSSEFDQNAAKWNDASIRHYRMQVDVKCYCVFAQINPILVEVRDNQVVSMMGANGVEILDTDPLYANLMTYATVDNLFTWSGEALANADKIEITYDATFGFPTQVVVDYIAESIDDEISVNVLNFEVLE